MARGTDTIDIGLADVPRTAPRLDVEGVTEIALADDGLSVTAAGGSQTAPALMRALEAKGHTVTSLDIRRASLEEVFVDLTRDDREYSEVSA